MTRAYKNGRPCPYPSVGEAFESALERSYVLALIAVWIVIIGLLLAIIGA